MCNTHRDRYAQAQDTKHGTYESLDAAIWNKTTFSLVDDQHWSTDILFVDTNGIHKESQPDHFSLFPRIIRNENLQYESVIQTKFQHNLAGDVMHQYYCRVSRSQRQTWRGCLLVVSMSRTWMVAGPLHMDTVTRKTPFPLVKGSGHISAVHPTDRLRTLTRRT